MPTTTKTAAPKQTTLEQQDVELTEAEILKGVPALLPAEQFRQRQRSKVTSMVLQLNGVVDSKGNFDTRDAAKSIIFLNLLGEADEFFESIAADRDAYVEWSTGLDNSEQIFSTLIAKYARAVGE